jgi:DNA-binding response OmpR family regulator
MSDRAGADSAGGPEGDRTILVVEDSPDIARLYRNCLRAEGYSVRTSHSVEEGLVQLEEDVDVAVLDRRLPDGEGTDVLAEIRERELDIRVAMVTAVVPDFDIIEMGFDLYMLKPASRADLIDVVEKLLLRTDYDAKLQETASLVSKQAVLEVEKDDEELEESEDYSRLVTQIGELDDELDALTSGFTMDDYRTMFREIGRA